MAVSLAVFGIFAVVPAAAATCSGNDVNIWSTKGSAAFSDDMETCGRQCALSSTECASECVQKREGYTSSCASCFGGVFGCTREHCKLKCVSGQTPACKQCVKDAGCAASFSTCSGFTPPSTAATASRATNCTGAADPQANVLRGFSQGAGVQRDRPCEGRVFQEWTGRHGSQWVWC